MPDDIVARLRVWSDWLDERCPDTEVRNDLRAAADEIERLHRDYSCICSEMRRMMDERDAARLQTRRILNEIDCRIEHGAESNWHLEAIRHLFTEANDDR